MSPATHHADGRPFIYLTSAAAVVAVRRGVARPDTSGAVGPGYAHSIMRRTPDRYAPALSGGVVPALMPTAGELATARAEGAAGDVGAFGRYCAALTARWARAGGEGRYRPGALTFGAQGAIEGAAWDGELWAPSGPVEPGDTLVCACGRSALCHRLAAAVVLACEGWCVVLDGMAPGAFDAALARVIDGEGVETLRAGVEPVAGEVGDQPGLPLAGGGR